jgi:hexokinase
LADELLSSFDYVKSLPTSKQRENNNLLQKRHRRIGWQVFEKLTDGRQGGQMVKIKVLEVDEKGSTLPLQ